MTSTTISKFLPNIKFFDISIKNGFNTFNKIYSLDQKKSILQNIIYRHKPSSMEIGSILPYNTPSEIKETITLYKYAESIGDSKYYLWMPPIKSCIEIAKKNNIKNISFITDNSNVYEINNYNYNPANAYKNIEQTLKTHNNFQNIKLNIPFFYKCPISDKYMKNNKIVEQVIRYCKFGKIKQICLSDTTGILEYDYFQDIMDNLFDYNIGPGRLGIHLHSINMSRNEIDRIILASIYRGIYNFDITSNNDIGGWVIRSNNDMNGTLNYYQIYNCFLTHWK